MIAPLDPRTRLREPEAAEYLGVEVKTLRNWRYAGTGPRSTRVGRKVQYRVAWLEEYIKAHEEAPIYWESATRQEKHMRVLKAA